MRRDGGFVELENFGSNEFLRVGCEFPLAIDRMHGKRVVEKEAGVKARREMMRR
jgi:hypothetical protein